VIEGDDPVDLGQRQADHARKPLRGLAGNVAEFLLDAVKHHDQAAGIALAFLDERREPRREGDLARRHENPQIGKPWIAGILSEKGLLVQGGAFFIDTFWSNLGQNGKALA
jgi:hypothetical protein